MAMNQRKVKRRTDGRGPRSIGDARRRNRKKRIRQRQKKRRIQIGLLLCCVLCALLIPYIVLRYQVSKYPKHKIYDNIYIGSVDVSGMTKKEAVQAMEKALKESRKVKVTMKVDQKSAKASLKTMGIAYKDIEKTVSQAFQYGKKGTVLSRYRKIRKLSKEKYIIQEKYILDKKKSVKAIEKKAVPLADHAVDATMIRTETGFRIIKEEQGETVDIEKSVSAIKKKLNSGWNYKEFSVTMTKKAEKPTVTEKDLETVTDELGSFSTDAGGGERLQNLKTGVGKLNGLVVAPGEEISVHDVTAPYDKEHGYVAAGSYENGQVVETYGGGICQVSTTLYNALLYAELEITERFPHSMMVAYIDPSRDAAIAGDVKDLKFKNNYKTPIYIEGTIDGDNQLKFTVYGKDTRKEGRTVEFESETTATEEYGKTYKADPEAQLGTIEYSGSPHTGKTARLWKIVKQDGKKVSRDIINESTYQKSDQILLVGTASENGAASGIVESAIATQDGDKINAAVKKAKAMEQ